VRLALVFAKLFGAQGRAHGAAPARPVSAHRQGTAHRDSTYTNHPPPRSRDSGQYMQRPRPGIRNGRPLPSPVGRAFHGRTFPALNRGTHCQHRPRNQEMPYCGEMLLVQSRAVDAILPALRSTRGAGRPIRASEARCTADSIWRYGATIWMRTAAIYRLKPRPVAGL